MNARLDWYFAIKELGSNMITHLIQIWLYVRVYVYTQFEHKIEQILKNRFINESDPLIEVAIITSTCMLIFWTLQCIYIFIREISKWP